MLQTLIEECPLGLNVDTCRPLSGGDIAQVYRIEDADSQPYVLKLMPQQSLRQLQGEARGLRELGANSDEQLHVPGVCCVLGSDAGSLLVLEYVGRARETKDSYEIFGRALAALHRRSESKQCGFFVPTWIGRTEQENTFRESWSSFYARFRLAPMVSALCSKGSLPPNLAERLDRIVEHSEQLTGEVTFYGLLHGDLWGGNHFFDKEGSAVLFDPACYYGDPLADIALTELFGPFPREFYAAYFESSGQDLHRYRQVGDLYRLYHGLNHLLLFGSSYLSLVESLASSIPL